MKFIEVAEIDKEFHWKPFNKEIETREVPVWLFDGYVDIRSKYLDLKAEIHSYPIKVPVKEGEIIKFDIND